MTSRLSSLFPLLLMAWATVGFGPASAEPARPNVVLIVTDDLGYGDVSYLARQVVPTPNIDRIAKSGVTFTQAT